MSPWAALLAPFGVHLFSARQIQAERFFLGNRHGGRIEDGARSELKAKNLTPNRAALLRAVIRASKR